MGNTISELRFDYLVSKTKNVNIKLNHKQRYHGYILRFIQYNQCEILLDISKNKLKPEYIKYTTHLPFYNNIDLINQNDTDDPLIKLELSNYNILINNILNDEFRKKKIVFEFLGYINGEVKNNINNNILEWQSGFETCIIGNINHVNPRFLNNIGNIYLLNENNNYYKINKEIISNIDLVKNKNDKNINIIPDDIDAILHDNNIGNDDENFIIVN